MEKIEIGNDKFLIKKEFCATREEILVTRFPFKVLIRCWALLRFAEERFLIENTMNITNI